MHILDKVVASKHIMHVIMKYVDIEFYFIRYLRMNGKLDVKSTPTEKQVINVLIKPLVETILFLLLKIKLKVLPSP